MLLMVFWFHLRSVRAFWEESDVSSSEVKVVEEGGRIVIRLAVLLWNYLISKKWLPGDLETGSLPCEGKTHNPSLHCITSNGKDKRLLCDIYLVG